MTREEAINEIKSWDFLNEKESEAVRTLIPELRESEDERIRKLLVALVTVAPTFSALAFTMKDSTDCLSYLEKQKEQKPSWKPSEEQMKALETTAHLSNFGCDTGRKNTLLSLCNDLKKL